MSSITEGLAAIAETQRTVDALLAAGDFKERNGDNSGWTLDPLYSNGDCDIGFVHIDSVDAGRCPDHVHENSIEYLIVLNGEILFNVDGRDLRIIRTGEIGVVPTGATHHSKPLTDDTRLVYICVPKDPGMEKLTKKVTNGK